MSSVESSAFMTETRIAGFGRRAGAFPDPLHEIVQRIQAHDLNHLL
jgi:hypothetical protein